MNIKYFTTEEANKTLPLVRRIVADITVLYPEWRELVNQFELVSAQARPEWGESPEQLALRSKIEDIARRITAYLAELESVGCVFKGFQEGLVDFYGKLDGRDVFWCWKQGEERIEHWHDIEAGFAGRQPIPQLMHAFWLVLHLLGFTLWIGGGIATMVTGIAAKGFAPEARLAVYRVTSVVWRIVVGPAALVVVLSGIPLSRPFMKSGVVPGGLGLMMGTGILGALIALGVALPAAAALGRLELDASGQLPPRFASIRKRLVLAASIAGGLALVALVAAAA